MTDNDNDRPIPRRISVPMDRELFNALVDEAQKDYRYPQMEAAVLIREALIARGAIKIDKRLG